VADKRAHIPIESRNYSVYYLVFSGLLFLGTVWAVVDEVSTRRPWKDYQREYRTMLVQKVQEQLNEEIAYFDSLSYYEIAGQVQAAQDSMRTPHYQALQREYTRVLEDIVESTREYQFAKSRGDEAYYFYKRSVREGREDLRQKARLERNEADMARHLELTRAHEARRDSLDEVLNIYRQNLRNAQAAMHDLYKEIDKWETKLRRVRGSTIEIKQVMMLDYDRNPFNDPKARVDRCQTCHLGWNEELMEDAPQPFKPHPLPELLKIHNPEVYGCTPCHRGQGPALTAGFAHGPDDHYWENPILQGIDVYASCNSCHRNESHLDHAKPFTRAKRLMIESGCHGCHEIQGYADLPKIGPELNRVGYKTTAEWVYRWMRNPKDYTAHTRMPNFLFNEEQAEAVTAYLMDVSRKNEFRIPRGQSAGGNARRGEELFNTVGCDGCHVVGDRTKVRDLRGASYDIAPELTRVGSKVNPDWAYDWVRDPRHYLPGTRMPSMRLTDSEARDIVAYLMTLRDTREHGPLSLEVSSPSVIERGGRLIREYGCNGCHGIPGMEKEGRVSVSLSNFGRKRVDEMDFGDTKVPHTWHDWTYNKLKNSRMFATDRIEQKMPVFSFNDEEIELLRMFLLAQTKDEPDLRYRRAFDKRQQGIEAGRRLAVHYNCQQCHELEKSGAYIGAVLDDPAYLPPIITGEGAKVQEWWLHSFLKNPAPTGQPNSIRPWIPIRMPTFQFTDAEITTLTKYFLGLSKQDLELRDYASFRPDPVLLPVGREIFNDFQCIKCHPAGTVVPRGGEVSTADLAPNLTLARGRLKPEWIVDWLADPGKIQPGTRMPTYFPDGQSPLPDVLDGDARKQMEAIRDYVLSIGQPARPVVSSR
jgi:cytochrome c2